MAKAMIDMSGTELSKSKMEPFEDKLKGKTLDFKTLNSDLDLNGQFTDPTAFKSDLWDRVIEHISLKSPARPKKIVSNIEEPGTYSVTLEFWDRSIDFKIKIAMPASGDKTGRQIKKNSHPPHVSVRNKGVNLADCPKDYADDLKGLLKEMGKTASYSYVGGTGSNKGWECKFSGHQSHEQPGEGFKAYIDEPSMKTGSKWRLYFEIDFDIPSQTLRVGLTKVSRDHP